MTHIHLLRSLVLLAAALPAPACAANFERGAAVTVDAAAVPGVRAWAGMPRGRPRRFATQIVASVDADGFFALAGGLALRAPHAFTPRVEAAFGLAAAQGPGGQCVIHEDGTSDCAGGIGPYVEGSFGLDVPLHGTLSLAVGAGGTAYLNGETPEGRALLYLGVVWK
jgi:hypothetical protein